MLQFSIVSSMQSSQFRRNVFNGIHFKYPYNQLRFVFLAIIEQQKSDLPSCYKHLEKWTESMKELLPSTEQ
jgi:hypothetical protein